MARKQRRFEVLFPLQFNDGTEVPHEWLPEAIKEIAAQFQGVTYESQPVTGEWRQGGQVYVDRHTRIIVEVADTKENHQWILAFRERWRIRLQQIELRLLSYVVTVE